MPGLSTVPAISGALARWARERMPGAEGLGSRCSSGTGTRKAREPSRARWRAASAGRRRVDLPFGRRLAYLGRSPDTELLRRDLGLGAEFRVVLEWNLAGLFIAAADPLWSRLGDRAQSRAAGLLSSISKPFGRLGSEGGCVQVELWEEERHISIAAVSVGSTPGDLAVCDSSGTAPRGAAAGTRCHPPRRMACRRLVDRRTSQARCAVPSPLTFSYAGRPTRMIASSMAGSPRQ